MKLPLADMLSLLSRETRQEYCPECSIVVLLKMILLSYTVSDPCFSTNWLLPLVARRLPLCIHCTESKLMATGIEVSTSQVSTENCLSTAFFGARSDTACIEPIQE